MKANELMIGDWLKHYNGTPMQVTKITTEHFACAENGGVNCWEYNNKFEPISLTSEILEKNGFEGIKEGRFPSLRNYYNDIIFQLEEIKEEGNCKSLYIFKNIPILYVHQLQHTLRLCRIDKKIRV